MKNTKAKKTSLITILLAVLGVCLLLVGGIGGARAALSTESADNTAEMTTPTIEVQLNENENTGVDGELPDLRAKEVFKPGKPYDEVLTVTNSSETAEAFVRVTIYAYWTDAEGNKITEWTDDETGEKIADLKPELINLINNKQNWAKADTINGWKKDANASKTEERTVLYYTKALAPKESSPAFLTQISVSNDISTEVETEIDTKEIDGKIYTTTTSTYQYDGLSLNVEVSVDAIQVHNADKAIKAAWGVTNVTADESGTLTVN